MRKIHTEVNTRANDGDLPRDCHGRGGAYTYILTGREQVCNQKWPAVRQPYGTPLPRSPKGYLEGVDLNALNTAVLEDFIELACIQAPEGALLLRIFGQELLVPRIGFRNDMRRLLKPPLRWKTRKRRPI